MSSETTKPEPRRGLRAADVLAIVAFLASLVVWGFAIGPVLLVAMEWHIADPGDAAIGMMVFGPMLVGVNFLLLAVSSVLCATARRLPIWFRMVMLLPPALGCAAGFAIALRGWSG